MKKKMVSSAWEIRRARIRYREGKRKFDGLEEDVGSRRKSVEKGCLEECNAILEEAMKQKEHIMEGARRRVRDERMRAVKLVRGRLLADAFRRVRRKLEMGVDADVRRSCLNHGLSELSRDLASGGASKIRERVGTGLG